MLINKFAVGFALLLAFLIGSQGDVFAAGKKKEAKFKVRIENVSNSEGLTASDGTKYPFTLSPGLFFVSKDKNNFFKVGKKAFSGIENQAKDGNPAVLPKSLLTKVGFGGMGIFNKPLGGNKPSPNFTGGAFEFEFTAVEGINSI